MRYPKKLGWLAGGGAAVGAVGEAVRGSQADPVVWVAGQGCVW